METSFTWYLYVLGPVTSPFESIFCIYYIKSNSMKFINLFSCFPKYLFKAFYTKKKTHKQDKNQFLMQKRRRRKKNLGIIFHSMSCPCIWCPKLSVFVCILYRACRENHFCLSKKGNKNLFHFNEISFHFHFLGN